VGVNWNPIPSGDDLAVAFARLTLGVALVHRQTNAERDRGQKLLAEVSDVFRRRGYLPCWAIYPSSTDGIDSSTPAGRMMIGVLGSLAEYERELIRERTALKRASSRANGTKFGRPRKVDDAEHITTAKRMKADGHTGRDIAKYLGVSRATLYRYLTEDIAV
jgi:hypothetical protein